MGSVYRLNWILTRLNPTKDCQHKLGLFFLVLICENSKVGESKLDSGMANPSFNDDSVEVEDETVETPAVVTDGVVQDAEATDVVQGDAGFANIVFDMNPEETVTQEETSTEQGATDNLLDDLI